MRLLDAKLFVAITRRRGERAIHYLDRGADIGARYGMEETPLHLALMEGQVDLVRLLLQRGADIHARNSLGQTPVLLAVRGEHEGVLGELLARGANVNEADNGGATPLMIACGHGFVPIIQLLLDHGANPNAVDQMQRNVLAYLQVDRFVEYSGVARNLIERGYQPAAEKYPWIAQAIAAVRNQDDDAFLNALHAPAAYRPAFDAEIRDRIACCDPKFLASYEQLSDAYASDISARRMRLQAGTSQIAAPRHQRPGVL